MDFENQHIIIIRFLQYIQFYVLLFEFMYFIAIF